jgi:hypothetical protein
MIEELERDKILKAIPNLPVEKQDTVKRILEELIKRFFRMYRFNLTQKPQVGGILVMVVLILLSGWGEL